MPLSRLYNSAALNFLIKRSPRIALVAAKFAALIDAEVAMRKRREINLLANFSRAFPYLSQEKIQLNLRNHKVCGYKAGIIYRYLMCSSRQKLHDYVTNEVSYIDAARVELIKQHSGPLILVTPHYGTYLSASLKLLQDIGSNKRFNLFFDHPNDNPGNEKYPEIYRRTENQNVSVLLNSRRSSIRAIRALQNNEILTMMPDVYKAGDNNISVPFFGGLTNAMTGTAFFALKTNAMIVPVYSYCTNGMKCLIDIQDPIPLSSSSNFDQALYETTAGLFQNIENQLTRIPEHWGYWSDFHHRFSCAARIPPLDSDVDTWKLQLHSLLSEVHASTPLLSPVIDKIQSELKEIA